MRNATARRGRKKESEKIAENSQSANVEKERRSKLSHEDAVATPDITSVTVGEGVSSTATVETEQLKDDCHVAQKSASTEKIPTKRGNYNAPILQYTLEGCLVARFDSQMDAVRNTGYKHSNINANLKGRQKSAYGFIWKYVVDENSIPETIPTKTSTITKHEARERIHKVNRTVNSKFAVYFFDSKNEIGTSQLFGRFNSQQAAADALGAKKSSVSKCVAGKYKSVCTVINGVKCKVAIIREEVA